MEFYSKRSFVVVVVIVQVDLLIGCGFMVNDSVEMLSRYHIYLISYQESLKRFYIFDSITLEYPDLDFPIRLPFMQMNQ
jgi:hypothetical protein